MRSIPRILALLIPCIVLGALGYARVTTVVAPTEANSFGPIAVQGVTIGNFGVVDGRIFRGEQPVGSQYEQLAQLGVKTVVDLRLDNMAEAKPAAEKAGLVYVNIGIDGTGEPSDEQVDRFLRLVDNPESGKLYVHCAGGRHRTGSMVALYRMTHDGWDSKRAYDEMIAYDFYTRDGHEKFKDYVFGYYARMESDPAAVPAAYNPITAACVFRAP